MSDPNIYPPGWNREKVQQVIDYYEQQTDEEAAAEHEMATEADKVTMMAIPNKLLPAVRALIDASH